MTDPPGASAGSSVALRPWSWPCWPPYGYPRPCFRFLATGSWRAASTRKAPIEDWVSLAIDRQKAEGCQAIFWLDATRAHDAELIRYVTPILEAKGVKIARRTIAKYRKELDIMSSHHR